MLLPDQMVTVRGLPLTARVPSRAPNRPTRRNQTRIILIAEDQMERAPATHGPIVRKVPEVRALTGLKAHTVTVATTPPSRDKLSMPSLAPAWVLAPPKVPLRVQSPPKPTGKSRTRRRRRRRRSSWTDSDRSPPPPTGWRAFSFGAAPPSPWLP